MLQDAVGAAARSALKLLGGAEQEVEEHNPVQEPLHEAIAALHRAAEAMDRHVEVLEGVAVTLPRLADALVKLTEQLGEALTLAAPLEAAERDIAGIGRLFRWRRHRGASRQSAVAPARIPRAVLTTPRAGEDEGATVAVSEAAPADGAADGGGES